MGVDRRPHFLSSCWLKVACLFLWHGPLRQAMRVSSEYSLRSSHEHSRKEFIQIDGWLPPGFFNEPTSQTLPPQPLKTSDREGQGASSTVFHWLDLKSHRQLHCIVFILFMISHSGSLATFKGRGIKHHLWKGQGMCVFPDSTSFLKPVLKWGHAIKRSVACNFI